MTDDTFQVDNALLENLSLFGKRTPSPDQPYLPGMEPLGPFDLWLTLGCYYLIDPLHPTEPRAVSLTSVLSTLDFSQTLARASSGYYWQSYATDDYERVKEAFHRLRTVEFPVWGYWRIATGKSRLKARKLVESYTGILSDYGYLYPDHLTPPDQLPEASRRNVNRALTAKNEPGPPIFQRIDAKPEAIYFQMARPVVMALIEGEKNHIGTTIFHKDIFRFRRQFSRNFAATKLLLRVIRQTNERWVIGLDKLVKQAGFIDDRQPTRNREATLQSLALLQEAHVIKGFSHDPKTDRVVVAKADQWHFPTLDEEDDEGLSTG
jgi:hypothetical protein